VEGRSEINDTTACRGGKSPSAGASGAAMPPQHFSAQETGVSAGLLFEQQESFAGA
jgi:hypothetical protein